MCPAASGQIRLWAGMCALGEHPVAAGVLEGVDLELGLLVGGGDAGIPEQMSHGVTVSQPSDSGGCATLISDTGSGHLQGGLGRGSGGCRRNARFRTVHL